MKHRTWVIKFTMDENNFLSINSSDTEFSNVERLGLISTLQMHESASQYRNVMDEIKIGDDRYDGNEIPRRRG